MSHNKWNNSDDFHRSNQSMADDMYFQHVRRKHGTAANITGIENGSGLSNSEQYLLQKSSQADPYSNLSGKGIQSLSSARQEQIHDLAQKEALPPRANLGEAHYIKSESLIREAQLSGNAGFTKQATFNQNAPVSINGQGSVTHIAPDLYSPLFLTQNLQLPRDRITANAWNRAYYQTNPYVRNAINLHATYPISKLNIKCEDRKKEQFFQDMIEKINLLDVVQQASLEYWTLGEAFVYSNFDESTGTWDKVYLHNPDYISVKQSAIPGATTISLRPDPELQKIVTSNDPVYSKLRDQLDPRVIHHVLQGEYIPLDSFNISHLKHLSSPYDVRGTSIIVSAWKDLMLYDKLRESKFVQADGMINPITLIKVGSSTPDGHYPRPEDLQAWQSIIEQAQYDKDFKIVTHPDVAIERVGFNGSVIETSADFQLIIDNILMGLMVPKAIITQEGATYASASVALDVMRQRYDNFRGMMANWLRQKIFAPIAEVQDFYAYKEGVKRLVLPEIEWNHMTLYDLDNYVSQLTQLYDKEPRAVSKKTLYRSLGLNVNDEESNLRREAVTEAIIQKEKAELAKKSLSDLRAMNPEKPIVESLPDVDTLESLPGAEAPAGAEVPDFGGGAGPGAMPSFDDLG